MTRRGDDHHPAVVGGRRPPIRLSYLHLARGAGRPGEREHGEGPSAHSPVPCNNANYCTSKKRPDTTGYGMFHPKNGGPHGRRVPGTGAMRGAGSPLMSTDNGRGRKTDGLTSCHCWHVALGFPCPCAQKRGKVRAAACSTLARRLASKYPSWWRSPPACPLPFTESLVLGFPSRTRQLVLETALNKSPAIALSSVRRYLEAVRPPTRAEGLQEAD